jgi:uncharacterized protein (TIGR02598 family)
VIRSADQRLSKDGSIHLHGRSSAFIRIHAFSLVEVVLAIGVIAFALLAVVGLIPLGIQSSKDATDDTRATAIAQDVFNRTQSQLDAYVVNLASTTGVGALPASIQTGLTFYYDNDGRFLNTSSPTAPITNYSTIANAIYQAQVSYGPPAAFTGSNAAYANANVDGTTLCAVKVSVGWPVVVNVSGATATIAPVNVSRRTYGFYMRSTLPVPSPTP